MFQQMVRVLNMNIRGGKEEPPNMKKHPCECVLHVSAGRAAKHEKRAYIGTFFMFRWRDGAGKLLNIENTPVWTCF